MTDFNRYLHPRSVVSWYLAVLLLSILGTYLAYNEPIGSNAWQAWSPAGENAWIKDSIRATAIALVSLFFLWNLNVVSSWDDESNHCYPLFRLSTAEKIIITFFTALLLILQFTYLRDDFVRNLVDKGYPSMAEQPDMYSFKQITLPYFPYSLYSLGTYVGLMLPILILSLRRFSFDFEVFLQSKRALLWFAQCDEKSIAACDTFQVRKIELAFQNYAILLKDLSERYLPLILGIAIFLIIEQVTSSRDTSTEAAVEITKILIWILLGPVLITFMTSVAVGYQITVKQLEKRLKVLIASVSAASEKCDIMDEIISFREKLIWSYSPLTFIVSTIKSASIAIPLLLTLVFYIMQVAINESNWLYIIFPKELVEFFKGLY